MAFWRWFFFSQGGICQFPGGYHSLDCFSPRWTIVFFPLGSFNIVNQWTVEPTLLGTNKPPPVWYFWRWFGYVASFECRISSLSWENLQEFFFVRCRFFKEDYCGGGGVVLFFSTILGGGFKYVLFSSLFGEMNGNDTMWLIFFRCYETTN